MHFSTIRSFGKLKEAVFLIFVDEAASFAVQLPASALHKVRLVLKEARSFTSSTNWLFDFYRAVPIQFLVSSLLDGSMRKPAGPSAATVVGIPQ